MGSNQGKVQDWMESMGTVTKPCTNYKGVQKSKFHLRVQI